MKRMMLWFTCAALTFLSLAPSAHAASALAPNTPVIPFGKDTNPGAAFSDINKLPLKIEAVLFVSTFTPCASITGYVGPAPLPPPGSGNLLARDAHTVGFCGIASVRLKKTVPTANLAGKNITIQVSSQHFNLTPWSTIVSLYVLLFPPSGDTLTYPRVAVSSFPGDNPALQSSIASNRQRQMDADYAFRGGRPVVVELKNNGQTLDTKNCTFKTFSSPNGPGPAQVTCP